MSQHTDTEDFTVQYCSVFFTMHSSLCLTNQCSHYLAYLKTINTFVNQHVQNIDFRSKKWEGGNTTFSTLTLFQPGPENISWFSHNVPTGPNTLYGHVLGLIIISFSMLRIWDIFHFNGIHPSPPYVILYQSCYGTNYVWVHFEN